MLRELIWPSGSSPLTRGKRERAALNGDCERLIPAHAGKTSHPSSVSSCRQAHPRSRGENMVSDGKVSLEDGSSPLTRGKPGFNIALEVHERLIPAHAGKTHSRIA